MLARVSAANGRNATSSSDEKLVAAAQTVVGFRLREDQSVEIQSVDTGNQVIPYAQNHNN